MKRRDVVRALLTPDSTRPLPGAEEVPTRTASGAVRAMGLEINRLAEEASAAESLRGLIAQGASVIELETALVDPSFVADRFDRMNDADYRRLVKSIRESGQQVPILVRPHPTEPGRYQIAYGHRRCAAAAELGLPVKAIVRPLRDDELVVAQGQENGERRNLSFIERALFAAALQRCGFDRATLNGALGVHTAEMTRLLAVADAIPEDVIRRIGPAPKAGRHRWQELARECGRPGSLAAVTQLLEQPSIIALPSDRRFDAIIAELRSRTVPPPPVALEVAVQTLTLADGTPVARLEHGTDGLRVTFDERAAPGVSDFAAHELRLLVARFQSAQR